MNKNSIEKEIYVPTLEVLESGCSDCKHYGILFDGEKSEVTRGMSIKETPFTPLYSRKHVDALVEHSFKNQEDFLKKIPNAIAIRYYEIVIEYITSLGASKEIYRFRIVPNADNQK